MPEDPDLNGHKARCRQQAKEITVNTLRRLADRIESGDLEHWHFSIEEMPVPTMDGDDMWEWRRSGRRSIMLKYVEPCP